MAEDESSGRPIYEFNTMMIAAYLETEPALKRQGYREASERARDLTHSNGEHAPEQAERLRMLAEDVGLSRNDVLDGYAVEFAQLLLKARRASGVRRLSDTLPDKEIARARRTLRRRGDEAGLRDLNRMVKVERYLDQLEAEDEVSGA